MTLTNNIMSLMLYRITGQNPLIKVLLSSSVILSETSFGDLLDLVPEAARTDGLIALVEGFSLRCKTQYEASGEPAEQYKLVIA